MSKKIIVDATFPNETRVVLLDKNKKIQDIEYETANKKLIKGNIYLAKVVRVEPSLQAAFIDYGNERHGFLPFTEISSDYYQIPISDLGATKNVYQISPPNISEDELSENGVSVEDLPSNGIASANDSEGEAIEFNLEVDEMDVDTISPSSTSKKDLRQYKIQEVVKKDQILLVQAIKEERGNKGATFTTYISLAGKYCVLMSNTADQNGISRKISNVIERKRLKDIVRKLIANDDNKISLIIRTAGIGQNAVSIKRDYEYLIRLWNKIREVTIKSTAPCFIHQEEGIMQKTVRDMLDSSVKEFLIQGEDAYNTAVKFMQNILPNELGKIKQYQDKTPIFTKFNVEESLSNLYKPVVTLASGGYIVINPTEALTAIDINSGRSTSERDIEETALKTNLEAAKEIAKQVKLRDLAGLIVVDFIDMSNIKNRKTVEKTLRSSLSQDRARIQLGVINSLGLLEFSRQRVRPSFLEIHAKICSHCNGKGLVRADEPNAMLILRTIESEICHSKVTTVNIYANANAISYILNKKRQEISYVENKYNVELQFYVDTNIDSDSFSIEKLRINSKAHKESEKPALEITSDIYPKANEDGFANRTKWNDNNHTSSKRKNYSKKTTLKETNAQEQKIEELENDNKGIEQIISDDVIQDNINFSGVKLDNSHDQLSGENDIGLTLVDTSDIKPNSDEERSDDETTKDEDGKVIKRPVRRRSGKLSKSSSRRKKYVAHKSKTQNVTEE